MEYKISDLEFSELKRYFDQNDTYGGATYLQELLKKWSKGSWHSEYFGSSSTDSPFEVGEGLKLTSTYYDRSRLEISDTLRQQIVDLNTRYLQLFDDVEELKAQHTVDGNHVPRIISTKEQYEEMKPHMDKEERVLVHTTFDKALRALD